MTMRSQTPFSIDGPCLERGRLVPRRLCVIDGRIAEGTPGPVRWKLSREQLLIPAFHDHHTHLVATHRPAQGPSLEGIPTRAAALTAVARWLREKPGEDPVLGEGWDESIWDDPRPLTGDDLDRLATDRPVGLRRVDGHLAVVNSAAWARLDPSGADAHPATRTLTEGLAMGLPARWAPPFEDLVQGARAGQRTAARCGVAAVDEMGRLETYRALRALQDEGNLTLRVRHFFPIEKLASLLDGGLTPDAGEGRLRVVGLKGFLDGSIGARTAAMAGPFLDGSDAGALLWETESLARAVRAGVEAGFSIALHAIGGRAVGQALEVYSRVEGARAGTELRVEHAEEIDRAALDLAARLGVRLSMQPNFTARWQGSGGMYERALGRERARSLNPYRSAADRTPVLFGSDTMPFGPLPGIAGALGHPDPGERLTPGEAIAAYAAGGIDPPRARDPLEAGRPADLVVLSAPGGDLAAAIRGGTARVDWTSIGGRTVWAAPEAEIPEDLLGTDS